MTDPLVLEGPEGTITVATAALTRLVVQAAESVEGARVRRPKRTVEVAHDGGHVSVGLELSVAHGVAVPELVRVVQERVATALGATSGLEIDRVDVAVEEVA